jgi:hypothetical protein
MPRIRWVGETLCLIKLAPVGAELHVVMPLLEPCLLVFTKYLGVSNISLSSIICTTSSRGHSKGTSTILILKRSCRTLEEGLAFITPAIGQLCMARGIDNIHSCSDTMDEAPCSSQLPSTLRKERQPLQTTCDSQNLEAWRFSNGLCPMAFSSTANSRGWKRRVLHTVLTLLDKCFGFCSDAIHMLPSEMVSCCQRCSSGKYVEMANTAVQTTRDTFDRRTT